MTIEEITEKLKDRKYLSVDEEEEYMQGVYDSTIGDIENYAFLTPNWINKNEITKESGMPRYPRTER